MYSPFPAATNSGRAEENLNLLGYFVESPKISNAERPCTRSIHEEDDQNSSNPRDSTSSSIFLISSRPSSATLSSETLFLWRNGSSRSAMIPSSPLCKTKLNTMRNRAPVETSMIKEDDDSDEEELGIPGLWIWSLVMLCAVAAALFIMWRILCSLPPELNIQGFRFRRIDVFAGTDRTNVPTYMISVNSTFNLTVKNRAKHYMMQLSHSVFTLYYNQVPIAEGQVSQGLKHGGDSTIVTSASVSCLEAPLYGSGPLLQASLADHGFAEFLLGGTVHTQLRIIGGIWNKQYNQNIRCNVLVNLLTLHVNHMDCKPAGKI